MAGPAKPDARQNESRASSAGENPEEPAAATDRRDWMVEGAALAFGGLAALVPLGIGAVTLLDPWRRRPSLPLSRQPSNQGREGFLRITSLDGLTVGGPPQRFPVIADQMDAWNFTPNQPVGAVFLQRIADAEVRCFNATCPHAGCSVSCNGSAFVCPCHNSAFNLDGTKQTSETGRENPSPRNMDELVVDRDQLAAREVWVQFLNFYTGRHEKVPKT
jgi:Rieske Fe-S protein